jgi:hypothetical protein
LSAICASRPERSCAAFVSSVRRSWYTRRSVTQNLHQQDHHHHHHQQQQHT